MDKDVILDNIAELEDVIDALNFIASEIMESDNITTDEINNMLTGVIEIHRRKIINFKNIIVGNTQLQSTGNMEQDMLISDYFRNKVKDRGFALDLYCALCNNEFIKDGIKFSCSWRYAGEMVAKLKGDGSYMDYYMSFDDNITEGVISDEIKTALKMIGWEKHETIG